VVAYHIFKYPARWGTLFKTLDHATILLLFLAAGLLMLLAGRGCLFLRHFLRAAFVVFPDHPYTVKGGKGGQRLH